MQRTLMLPPESLYIKAGATPSAKYDRIREVVALRDRVEKLEQLVGKLTWRMTY